MLFKKLLNMKEIKGWFDSENWDMGYLTKEQLQICSLTPIKIKYQLIYFRKEIFLPKSLGHQWKILELGKKY